MFGEPEAAGDLNETAWTQPALYALESALVELWASVGVRPAAVLGHSVGEIAAARAAGVFGLEDGLRFAAARGELMGSLPAGGAMAAVFASAERVLAALEKANSEAEVPGLAMAADNGTHQVVSGPLEQVEALAAELGTAGVRVERLNTSHAFHSALMEPVLGDLEEILEGISVKPPEVALVSNVTGQAVESGEVLDGVYWRRHAREPVAFAEGVRTLAGLGVEAVVEIGPGPVLGPLVALGWPEGESGAARGPAVLSSLRGLRGSGAFGEAVARAYAAGLVIEFGGLFAGERRRRVSVPTYPFQRQRYWITERRRARPEGVHHPLLGARRQSAGGETTFETDLFALDPDWLGDHRVFGRVVAPGALYGSLAATAGFLVGEGEAVSVENLRIHAPLILQEGGDGEEGRTVQVVAGRAGDGLARTVEIFSRGRDGEAWTLHAQGQVSAGVGPSDGMDRVDLDALEARLAPGSVDLVYEGAATAGVELGPLFRVLESIRTGEREAVGELALRDELAADGLPAHPTLLDGCIQVLASLLGGSVSAGRSSYLPFGWDRLWLAGPLPGRLVCRARLRTDFAGAGEGAVPEVLTADLDLYATDGAPLGAVSGLTMKRATPAALLASAEAGGGSLYRLAWKEQAEVGPEALPEGAVLVTGGSETSAGVAALEAALARRGVRALAGSGEDPGRLLKAVQEVGELAGVVLVAPAQGEAQQPGDGTLRWLLLLAQALLERDSGLAFGLVVVTEAGVAAEPGERVDPGSASVWGFGRSLQSEQRSLGVRLLDAGTGGAERSAVEQRAEEAAAALLAEGGESQQALRGGQVLVPRLERERQRVPAAGSWWRIGGRAGLERVDAAEAAGREPGAGELTLSLRACGLDGAGSTGGVAGVVTAVGPDVEHVVAGERAFGLAGDALAGRVTLPAGMVRRLPAGLQMARAAALAGPYVTAALACEGADLAAGERVLVDAASAGEAGLAAAQLAREAGAEVYVVASAAQRESLESLGVAGVLDAEAADLAERLLEATGRSGADVVLGRAPEAVGPRLGPGGRFVELAGPGGWVKVQPERAGALLEGVAERIVAGEPGLPPTRRCPLGEIEAAQRLARSGRHLGGIALTLDEIGFRADASYLITGGLGALGLEAAEWLAGQGAGHLVLVGRSAAGAEARERLAGLEAATGSRVVTARADVADAAELAGLLERFAGGDAASGEWPPLAGVIHAAGVLDDGVVTGQTAERMARVLRPKMQGAWQLHRLTRDLDLDLFVLYSSAVATVGLPGQTSYAAANGYLDGLAGLRRSEGLAATSVAWGAWAAGGMAASEAAQEGFARRGVLPLSAERAHGALAELLASTPANGTVMDADWRRMAQDPVASHLPMLAGLLEVAPAAKTAGASLAERLRGTPDAEREGVLVEFLRTELQAVLQRPSPPEPDVGFFDLGMDSLMAVEFRNRLNDAFGGEYVAPMTVVFDYPDVRGLARHVAAELGLLSAESEPERREPARDEGGGIAVVGLACRFPGGPDLAGFWELLSEGRCAVTEGRPEAAGGPRHWGAYVDGIDRFDAEFFRIAPVEARLLDPQQRLLLETSWQALEDAGIAPGTLAGGRAGVYAGITNNDYRELITAQQETAGLYMATGNSPSTAIGRVAFTLGLEGPAMAVDTACSSALVALHQAVVGLQRGEADLALAGGVNAILTPTVTESFASGGMLAPDGRCKTFDAAADGYVRGEGCGMVVLKRLADAEADGDRIWGVIRGTAVNQDGASAGLTVPNGPAQEQVIAEALARAGVEPAEVDYLEAHGTGTSLGDPIEVGAAAAVYGRGRESKSPLLIGSVKTNVGHLEAAAGVAGLVKVLLAMNRGVIPKHLHFTRPSPRMDWERLPLQVTAEATQWPETEGRPVRAGVSSFGYSGTNAHVVVEAYKVLADGMDGPDGTRLPVVRPDADGLAEEARSWLLPLSGKSDAAVRELAGRYLDWMRGRSAVLEARGEAAESDSGRPTAGTLLADMAWTAGAGRSHFGRRAGVVFGDAAELRQKLEDLAGGGAVATARKGPKLAFVFTGQGSQWAGMGRELYETEPVARAVLERCEQAMREMRGASLLAVMFGEAEAAGDLDDTAWTQPALYALESALAELWASLGVRPAAVLGHSLGEIAAAHVAGAFGLEDGLRFAATRGELMGSLPPGGAMAAVFASAARVAAALEEANGGAGGPGLAVAADNGTHQVVSGSASSVAELAEKLAADGVRVESLNTSHAFHSALMEPVLGALEEALEGVSVKPPEVVLVSNVTGRAVESGEVMDAAYWRRHAREPVAFAEGVRTLAGLGVEAVVEIGPGPVLGPLVSSAWLTDGAERLPPVVIGSQRRGRSGATAFAEAVAQAYEAGTSIAFAGLYAGASRRRVSVPTYPFQRQRYWIEERKRRSGAGGHPLLGVRRDSAGGETTFETDLFATDPAWLADHRVFGQVVAPGALYGSLAAAAATSLRSHAGAVAVEDMRLHSPLVLSESGEDGEQARGRTVQVTVSPDEQGTASIVRIYSRDMQEEAWTLHAEALGRGDRRTSNAQGGSGRHDGGPDGCRFDLLLWGLLECGSRIRTDVQGSAIGQIRQGRSCGGSGASARCRRVGSPSRAA